MFRRTRAAVAAIHLMTVFITRQRLATLRFGCLGPSWRRFHQCDANGTHQKKAPHTPEESKTWTGPPLDRPLPLTSVRPCSVRPVGSGPGPHRSPACSRAVRVKGTHLTNLAKRTVTLVMLHVTAHLFTTTIASPRNRPESHRGFPCARGILEAVARSPPCSARNVVTEAAAAVARAGAGQHHAVPAGEFQQWSHPPCLLQQLKPGP